MLYLVKDDVGTQVKAVLTREDTGLAADLTGYTVLLRIRNKGESTVLKTLTAISSSDELAIGEAIFAFSSGDLDLPEGKYEGEIEGTSTGGAVESVFEIIDIYIRADF